MVVSSKVGGRLHKTHNNNYYFENQDTAGKFEVLRAAYLSLPPLPLVDCLQYGIVGV